MSPPIKLEARGVRCLECTGLDLKAHPAVAKEGAGRCQYAQPVVFVRYEMSRNCLPFDPAASQVVVARESWAELLPRWWRS